MSRKGLRFDVPLCMGVLSLVGIGMVLIYSSSAPLAAVKGLPDSFYLTQHIKKVIVGLIAFLVGMLVPYRAWEKFSRPLLGVSEVSGVSCEGRFIAPTIAGAGSRTGVGSTTCARR